MDTNFSGGRGHISSGYRGKDRKIKDRKMGGGRNLFHFYFSAAKFFCLNSPLKLATGAKAPNI
jgi:hypothetical protein